MILKANRLNNDKLKHIDNILLIALLLIVSDDTLIFGTNVNKKFIAIKYAIIIFFTIILSIKYIFPKVRKADFAFVYSALLVSFLLISSIWNEDLRSGVWYKIALIFLALAFIRKIKFYEFAICYDKILFFLSVTSLIGYFTFLIGKDFMTFLPTFKNSAGTEFYNGILFMVPKYIFPLRNYGIFREPGVFQMFVIIALTLQLSVIKTARVGKLLIYVVTILTTLSTTGFFALAVIILIMLFKRRALNKKTYQIAIMIAALALVIFTFTSPDFIEEILNIVFGKLVDTSRYTTIARLASVFVNIRIWLDNFLFGVGLTQLSELFPLYSLKMYGHATTHNTNTWLIQFSSHGFLYGSLWSYAYFKLAKQLGNNTFEVWMYCCIFLILFSGENLTFSVITYILLLYGISNIKEEISTSTSSSNLVIQ